MATQKYYAQFNKYNKLFITILQWLPEEYYRLLNHDQYLYKEVELDEETETIKGDYDDFRVVKIADQPLPVYERTLNDLARQKIEKQFSMPKQLSIICEQLTKLSESEGIDASDVKEMLSYINEVKKENRLRKEFYAEDPDYDYWTEEEEDEYQAKQEDGGIIEYDERLRSL